MSPVRPPHNALRSGSSAGTPPASLWAQAPVRETVGAAAYRLLREAILRGRIPPGARINELELADAWNISRTPIRDALRRLEAEGLVLPVPGRGVVVPVQGLAEAADYYELRELLEVRAARRAAERALPDFGARLNGLIRSFGIALRQGDDGQMAAIDAEFHAAVAAASANARLEHAIATVLGQVYQIRERTFRVKGRAARSLREMARLAAAIRARDATRAESAMREHITSLRDDLPSIFAAD